MNKRILIIKIDYFIYNINNYILVIIKIFYQSMKMFISIFSILLLSLINSSKISSKIYTPNSLKNFYDISIKNTKDDTFPNIFLDPEKYIRSVSDLINLQEEILNQNKIYTLIGVISNFQGSLEKFAYKFTQIFYDNNITYINNSITIIYSMTKREIWITTGDTARREYNNSIINYLLYKTKTKLKNNKVRKGFKKLLRGILYIENTKNRLANSKKYAIISSILSTLSWIFLLFFIYFAIRKYYKGKCFDCFYKKRELTITEQAYFKNLEQFLNNINKNKTFQNDIFTDNCIICLTSLNKNIIIDTVQELNNLKSNDFNLSNNQLSISEQKISNQENDDMTKKTLECGHSFHKKCIEEWLKKVKICPLCKEHFEIPIDSENAQKKIMNIQSVVNPLIKKLGFYYEGNRMINKRQPRIYPLKKNNFNRRSNSNNN